MLLVVGTQMSDRRLAALSGTLARAQAEVQDYIESCYLSSVI